MDCSPEPSVTEHGDACLQSALDVLVVLECGSCEWWSLDSLAK